MQNITPPAAMNQESRPIDALPFSTRARNALRQAGIRTVGELSALVPEDVLLIPDIGYTTLEHIIRVLRREGLLLRGAENADLSRDIQAVFDSALHLLTTTEVPPAWADMPIGSLGLTRRSHNSLRRSGIATVGMLCRTPPAELMSIRSFGRSCLEEVSQALQRSGIRGGHEVALRPESPAPPSELAAYLTERLDLSVRPYRVLEKAGIRTLGQLCAHSALELLKLPNMGRVSLAEVVNALARFGLVLAGGKLGDPGAVQAPPPPPDAATLAGWLALLFEKVPAKYVEVLVRRNGLLTGEPVTLAEVGNQLGVTRMRIGQIETTARERVNRAAAFRLERFSRQIAAVVRSSGGVVRVEELADAMARTYSATGVDPVAFARFTFPFCRDLVSLPNDLWAVDETSRHEWEQVGSTLERLLREERMPVRTAALLARANAELDWLSPQFVEACLRTSNRILSVQGNYAFLASWRHGSKSRWILAALREIGRPAHFTEIGASLRELVPELADMIDFNVREILGRLTDEVDRTDAGTFSLKNWGVDGDRYIRGLLEAALEEIGGPATFEQLMAYVMERKVCTESSIRATLESDGRFQRLGRGVYSLARWAAQAGTEEQLAQVRVVPQRPVRILHVLEHLVREGRLAPDQLRGHLADLRQLSRLDDYGQYLTRRGWAVLEPDGVLVPTNAAREFYASVAPADRVFWFAMADANFQAYLIFLFVEHLIRLSWTKRGGVKATGLLAGPLAPLRVIYTITLARLDSRTSQLASAEEREMNLLQTVRAPGMPQVFGRWLEPVTGYNQNAAGLVLKRLTARLESFPSLPSVLDLSHIPGPAARLLVLAAALAAADDAAVDYRRLAAYGELVGLQCPALPALTAELLVSGIFLDDRDVSRVGLLSPHVVSVSADDIPGGLHRDLGSFGAALWEARVLVSQGDVRDSRPDVRIQLVSQVPTVASTRRVAGPTPRRGRGRRSGTA